MRVIVLILATLLSSSQSRGAGDLAEARMLFEAKRYPEAKVVLEKLLATDPNQAAAAHYLGLTIKSRHDSAALPEALKWLAKAAELEPRNAVYLGDFGGASLQLAARTNSLTAATKGRDAMEKALMIDPGYLDAREGLIQFYQRAPWPIGSAAKANAHLAELRKRDPDRATVLTVMTKANAKDYPAAFALCEEVLARNPDNYAALYHYGRTAAISGQNLERGLTHLQHCLKQSPPTPASATHSNVWQRIGNIHARLERRDDARTAYENALELDPGNRQAEDALAALK